MLITSLKTNRETGKKSSGKMLLTVSD